MIMDDEQYMMKNFGLEKSSSCSIRYPLNDDFAYNIKILRYGKFIKYHVTELFSPPLLSERSLRHYLNHTSH